MTLTEKQRNDWKKRRRELITASDWYPILFGSALSVYEKKVSGYEDADCDLFVFGRAAEGPVADVYAYKTGRDVMDLGATEIQIHPDIPWLGATLDRWQTVAEDHVWNGPLELKTALGGKKSHEWTDHHAPIENETQLQAQLACAVAKRGTVCGMTWGPKWIWHDQDRRDDFLEAAYPILDAFRLRVQLRDPPPVHSAICLSVVKRMYPEGNGEEVTLNRRDLGLVDALQTLKVDKAKRDNLIKEIEAELRFSLKDAEWGALPDGRWLRLATHHRDGYTVEPTSYRQLTIVNTRER